MPTLIGNGIGNPVQSLVKRSVWEETKTNVNNTISFTNWALANNSICPAIFDRVKVTVWSQTSITLGERWT